MKWVVVYARIEPDKYNLGCAGKFDDREKAIEFARRLESKGYYWAGVIEFFWEEGM